MTRIKSFQQKYYELLLEYYIQLEGLNDDLRDIQRLAKRCEKKLGLRILLEKERDE